MDSKLIKPEDYKYFVEKPTSFSPQRNKAVINETIKETEKFFDNIGKAVDDNLGNRIDVLSSYGVYRMNKGDKSFKDYAGKQLYTRLIGEKILERVRVMESVNRLNGNTKFKNFIQL